MAETSVDTVTGPTGDTALVADALAMPEIGEPWGASAPSTATALGPEPTSAAEWEHRAERYRRADGRYVVRCSRVETRMPRFDDIPIWSEPS